MPTDVAGSVYYEAVNSALAEEAARKISIETRGIGVIATSGTLVTLLFGLAALITKAAGYVLPTTTIPLLVVALALFGLAIAAAFASFVPRAGYESIAIDDVSRCVRDNWADTADAAKKGLVDGRLSALRTARKLNGDKALYLTFAVSFQIVAVVLIGATVLLILVGAR